MWALLALMAGVSQTARNAFARSLAGKIPPALNSWSRFAFNLPFSTTLLGILLLLRGTPQSSSHYYLFCLLTAVTQLLGNVCLVAAFDHSNFAQSILLFKLEIVFAALVGLALFDEQPSSTGWLGIGLSAMGVLFINLARERGSRWWKAFHFDWGALLALTSGLFLVFASFLLKAANAELVDLNPRVGTDRFEVAIHTLFNTTWMEVALLTLWLASFRRAELPKIRLHWRRMLLIGFTSFVGSVGWFWAYSLTLVAYVKAVGQIELVLAVMLALVVWKEREVLRQLPGVALVCAGILLILLG